MEKSGDTFLELTGTTRHNQNIPCVCAGPSYFCFCSSYAVVGSEGNASLSPAFVLFNTFCTNSISFLHFG